MKKNIEERQILNFCECCKKELTKEQIEKRIIDKMPFTCENCLAFLLEQIKICAPLWQNMRF